MFIDTYANSFNLRDIFKMGILILKSSLITDFKMDLCFAVFLPTKEIKHTDENLKGSWNSWLILFIGYSNLAITV